MRVFLLALLLTACGSQEPVTPPPKSDTGVDAFVAPDVPCGGACGPGTVCEIGRCVPVDAGSVVDLLAPEDQARVDVLRDAGTPPEDRASDASLDAGCTAAADCPADLRAMFICTMGRCAVRGCTSGWANCDGDDANGCETSVATDLANCGMCGRRCPVDGPGQPSRAYVCANGGCSLRCTPGFDNCDGTLDNGCESLESSPHCGACGNRCTGKRYCTATDGGFACR